MKLRGSLSVAPFSALVLGLSLLPVQPLAAQSSSSSSGAATGGVTYVREKTPTLVDPAGPTISLISGEPVFIMAAALNTCGYDEGLATSLPDRKRIREQIASVLDKSEPARASRDAVCLYITQHRMTGTERDNSQYLSLSLYLTPPPELEVTADLTEMPPDATQVVEIAPLLKTFAEAVDLHGLWLTTHRLYDTYIDRLHDPLSQMIVNTNLYLKMPASTYDGRRFIVVVEPQLAPGTVNARIYGTDYVVLVSPAADGTVRMNDIRHTYLHYLIEPLLYARSNAIDRSNPMLKEIREAPLDFRYRSDTVALTIECLIKAIEARTMNTGIADLKIQAGLDRSEITRLEIARRQVQSKQEVVRVAAVRHDMTQGFVLTQYFYEQMTQFEKDAAGLKDTIGEMVYSMDVDQQIHRTRMLEFDKEADGDVLGRSKPKKLEGLDLAEAKLAMGDPKTAQQMAEQALKAAKGDDSQPEAARAHFILARTEALTGHPEEAIHNFQKTLDTSKENRTISWSHIYLGRMFDLDCAREQAVGEYKLALEKRDGRQDTRLAAERGLKAAYMVNGHSCEAEADDDKADSNPAATPAAAPASSPAQTPKAATK